MKRTTIDDCTIIDLPRILIPQGNITPVENQRDIPFDIKRVYYLYDVPGGAERGGHAHKNLEQVIVSLMGSFDINLDDGENSKIVSLNRAYYGLYIPPMMWRHLSNFSSGGVCLVLASLPYDENEYIRDYEEYRAAKGPA
jgi:oxalate decarboxylase/phosphoglucose isomerase-like protein (cupin superfamily)